jgi:chitin disaccharide deacetylase
MTRQLIVNADDFGYSPGVTRGIIEAHRRGIVTSTTVMVNMPGAPEAVEQALIDTPNLGLGLHLNLTAGRPVVAGDTIPDLVGPNGEFHSRSTAFARLSLMDPQQLEVEMRAQLSRFIDLAGRAPDHLDSHHHATYASPTTINIMLDLAEELGVGIRRPLPDMPLSAIASAMGYGDQETELATKEIETLAAMLDSTTVPTPDCFVMSFYKATATLGDLLNIVLDLQEGVTEIMCHPAYVDDVLSAKSSYILERKQELSALTHPSVREIIESQGIELITFGALLNR